VESVTLRPETAEDADFLCALYASTRAGELAVVPWSEEQKADFLRQQFHFQTIHYKTQYPGATFEIILTAGIPAGRIYLHRLEQEIRLMDIALLPEYCGKGIGGYLIGRVLREAEDTGKYVSIHVEKHNPAQRLYARLGFRPVSDVGIYALLEWRSGAPPAHAGDAEPGQPKDQ
jgi:ribosomal protein S18 acetylase RimI-like enzyme